MALFQKSVLNDFYKGVVEAPIRQDQKIGKMVYKLYGLDGDEIKIVESS